MDFDQVAAAINSTLQSHCDRSLTDLEIDLLRGAWNDLTYDEIATASGYSLNYLQRDFGPRFWKLLSEAYGRKVSKVNAKAVLTREVRSGRIRGEDVCSPALNCWNRCKNKYSRGSARWQALRAEGYL